MSSNWVPRTQAHWLIALSLSFKFIGGYSAVQLPYQGSWYCSASPLLFDPDPSWQNPISVSLSFPTQGIHIECVLMFPFPHRISCMREFLLSSSCVAYNADWYTQLGVLPIFCNVSCPDCLWTKHTYQVVPSEIIGWFHTFHRLSIPSDIKI